MALLAETIVEEWLNREGYFTIRGVKAGLFEIDLLAIKPRYNEKPEALHVEVQASFRPMGYITKLRDRAAKDMGVGKTSAKRRTLEILKECAGGWVDKKIS